MGGVDEGGMARRFWIKFKSDSIFALYTPFIVCLASGKLDRDTFRHCISQDVHFLKAFAQAYDLAKECADDEEDRTAIRKLRKRVDHKLKSLDAIVREWGFELLEECTSNHATAKYTEFLLAAASGKIEGEKVPVTPFEKTKVAAYTLGAMAPCMRLVGFVSKEIQDLLEPDDTSHIYKKWIDSYCSEDFEAAALQIEDMLDKLSVSLTGEELDIIEKLYHQAMKLEVNFFSSQPIVQRTVVPLSRLQHLVGGQLTILCDFDLTCTAFDSSAILAEIAILTAPKADSDGSNKLPRMASADLRSAWSGLSTQYLEEYEQCIESIIPAETVEKFSYEEICGALEQLGGFEKKANSRVVESGVLRGLSQEDIKRTGHRLILQDGCKAFFQSILKNENIKCNAHILSYCWCGDLIRSALSSGDMNDLKVHSNELAFEESISTGEIVGLVESPMEKLQIFKNVLNDSNADQHLSVYIGGSVGDLLCLLEADIGIVINPSSSLRRLGDQFGVTFRPLFSGLVEKQRELDESGSSNWKGLSGILYTVSSWAEIHAFILGL